MTPESKPADAEWRPISPNNAAYWRAQAEANANDALLGRFVRQHIVELGGGWQINQTFIPGAPSLESVTDAIDHSTPA